jgi:hypothetical protein
MIRLTLALAIGMNVVPTAAASLAPPKEPPRFGKPAPPARTPKPLTEPRVPVADRGTTPEFVLTAQTEVLLNGKPCKYEMIPGHARIVLLELAADNKTVVKIHFRTGK